MSRLLTAIEIRPVADIGDRLCIHHGMGVVIGETADIGDDVMMYHGETLGGNSMRRSKRHPTVEDGTTVGVNATLIGTVTIGENATVGAGAPIIDDVPAGETVAGVPAEPINGTTPMAAPVAGNDGD